MQGTRSNFVGHESFLESNSSDILALCEINLEDLINSSIFSLKGYPLLIQKCSETHVWFCSFCEGGTTFYTGVTYEKSENSYLCFRLALFHSLSYFFFLHPSPSPCLYTVFDAISFNIDKVLSVNPSVNTLVFEDFNVHHKDWLSYSGGADGPSEIYHNFSTSNDLTQLDKFPTRIPDCVCHIPTLLDLFSFSDPSICSTVAFPPYWLPAKIRKGCPFSWCSLWLIMCRLERILWSCESCSMGGDIFKLSPAATEFYLLSPIYVYIFYIVNMGWILIHLQGFQLLVLLP